MYNEGGRSSLSTFIDTVLYGKLAIQSLPQSDLAGSLKSNKKSLIEIHVVLLDDEYN